jgi:hypothetical protein
MEDLNERDLFAMLAMCGMLAHDGVVHKESIKQEDDRRGATRAYEIADAMMIARQPKGENHGS